MHDKDDDDVSGDNGVEKRPWTITITTTRRKNRVMMLTDDETTSVWLLQFLLTSTTCA